MIGFFVLLIFVMIGRNSTWFDESYTLLLVGPHDFADIARRTAVDGHPPLWYWVIKPWLSAFGPTVVAARAQSAVFMIAGIAVWYRFVRTRFSRTHALVALALIVTNPMMMHYAVEGRMYAFGILLTGITTTLVTGRWKWRWFAYWPIAVAMLYTHYFLAFIVGGQFLYLLLDRKAQGVKLWWIFVFGGSIVAAFIPWIPYAAHQTKSIVSGGFWIPPIAPSTFLRYVMLAFLHRLDTDLEGPLVFISLPFFVAWIAAFINSRKNTTGDQRVLWCLLGVPWALLFVLSCKPFVPIFHPRYVIFSLPALITLLAAGVLMLAARWRWIALTALVLGHFAGIGMFFVRGTSDVKLTMKTVAREVAEPVDGEVPWVVATWQFAFFDAKATIRDKQRVVILRQWDPEFGSTDALYYDKPDWWILSLDQVQANHAWLIEDGSKDPTQLPPGWSLMTTHRRGYVNTRLIVRDPPRAFGH